MMEINFSSDGYHRCVASMSIRRWSKASCPPLDFENFNKKGCFLDFEWEKTNFTTFGPLKKFWKNP